MHTIMADNSDMTEWSVGRMAFSEECDYEMFVPIFSGLGLTQAVRLCGRLNGGDTVAAEPSHVVLQACAKRASQGRAR